MAQQIVIREYNSIWRKMFEEEAAAVRKILKNNCIAVHHIGRTAVEGLAAKSIKAHY